MNTTPEQFARPQTQYLRATAIQERYHLSRSQFYRLRHLVNPIKRFPHPTLILGDTPLWSEDVLTAWEAGQRREEEQRERNRKKRAAAKKTKAAQAREERRLRKIKDREGSFK